MTEPFRSLALPRLTRRCEYHKYQQYVGIIAEKQARVGIRDQRVGKEKTVTAGGR